MLLFQLDLSPPDPILVLSWGKALPGPLWGHWEVWVLVWHCQPLFPAAQHPPVPLPSLTPPLFSACSFQIIDSENEALLAALTETLDDIQGDDMGLAVFRTMEEGDTLNHAYTSPAPSPKPTAPEEGPTRHPRAGKGPAAAWRRPCQPHLFAAPAPTR